MGLMMMNTSCSLRRYGISKGSLEMSKGVLQNAVLGGNQVSEKQSSTHLFLQLEDPLSKVAFYSFHEEKENSLEVSYETYEYLNWIEVKLLEWKVIYMQAYIGSIDT